MAEPERPYFIRYGRAPTVRLHLLRAEPAGCRGELLEPAFRRMFKLISVNDGNIEAFWSVERETFFTVPGRDEEVGL